MLTPALAVALATSVLGPSEIEAPERVAVLPIDSHATLPDPSRAQLRKAIEQGLERAGVQVIDSARVDAELGDTMCTDAQCAANLGRAVDATWVVRPTITAADSVYAVFLEVVDGQGHALASARERCEICGSREVVELVVDRSAALGEKMHQLTRQAPRLHLSTAPRGAGVWVDGQRVGRTPLEHELTPGPHEVRVELRGYVSERREVTALPGTVDTLAITLVQTPRARRPWLGLGVAALVTGGIALGSGITLAAIDEREYQRRCNPDALGRCSHRYDTLAGGMTLAVGGGMLLVTGAVLLVADRRRRGRAASRRTQWRAGDGLTLQF